MFRSLVRRTVSTGASRNAACSSCTPLSASTSAARFYAHGRYVTPKPALDADDSAGIRFKKMQNDPVLIEQERQTLKEEPSGVEENEQAGSMGTIIVEEDEMEIGDRFFGPDHDTTVKPQVALIWLTGALTCMGAFLGACYMRSKQLEPALAPRKMQGQ